MRKADFATPPLTKALAAPVEMAVFGWKGEATADSCGADKRQSRSSACSPRRRITTKRQRRKQKQIPFGNDNQKSNGLVAGGRVTSHPGCCGWTRVQNARSTSIRRGRIWRLRRGSVCPGGPGGIVSGLVRHRGLRG